jgi:hypothetical protein
MKLFTPDPKLVAEEVAKRPYEPFGLPNQTSTVKPDDNIQQPDLKDLKARIDRYEFNDKELGNRVREFEKAVGCKKDH